MGIISKKDFNRFSRIDPDTTVSIDTRICILNTFIEFEFNPSSLSKVIVFSHNTFRHSNSLTEIPKSSYGFYVIQNMYFHKNVRLEFFLSR